MPRDAAGLLRGAVCRFLVRSPQLGELRILMRRRRSVLKRELLQPILLRCGLLRLGPSVLWRALHRHEHRLHQLRGLRQRLPRWLLLQRRRGGQRLRLHAGLHGGHLCRQVRHAGEQLRPGRQLLLPELRGGELHAAGGRRRPRGVPGRREVLRPQRRVRGRGTGLVVVRYRLLRPRMLWFYWGLRMTAACPPDRRAPVAGRPAPRRRARAYATVRSCAIPSAACGSPPLLGSGKKQAIR